MNSALDIRNRIDELCDTFDRQWSADSLQQIAELLPLAPVQHTGLLLRELVQIDWERCLKSEQKVPFSRYAEHFPEYADELQAVAAELDSSVAQHGTTLSGDAAQPQLPDIDVSQMVGPYQLQERIGEGGMGVVYRAIHQELGRTVALKIVALPMADAISRFQAEARTIAGLNHPHIVQIFETGEYQQRPFLALELMHGGSLDVLLRKDLPVPQRAAEILLQITAAVAAAHEFGIIHRDLKPANVLLDGDGNAKLADFGLARNLNLDSQTISGTLLGTPGFMSPEQTIGSEPSVQMDIYGLGAVLYATLTGRPPFRGASIPETLRMVREYEPVSIRNLVPGVPVDLESICLKCLQKKPAARYASAAELADELRAFQQGRPVKARLPSRREKFLRWCLRHPTETLLSSILLMAVLLGGLGVVWQWRRAETNADQFRQAAEFASAETRRAEQEKDTAQAVNRFLRDMLAAAQPTRLGRKATIVDVLEQAVQEVDNAFDQHPRIEAAIRRTLGETYRSLGDGAAAIQQFRSALKIYQSEFGSTQAQTLEVMDDLAGALRSLGDDDQDLQEALALRKAVVAARRESLGETHPLTIAALSNLANVLVKAGDSDSAEKLYRSALAAMKTQPQVPLQDEFAVRFNLASILWDRGLLVDAEREVRAVIDDLQNQTDAFEGTEIELLNAQNTLAGILVDAGQPDQARTVYQTVLQERRDVLGRDHPHTLSTHRRLIRLLVQMQDFVGALPVVNDCLEIHNHRFGEAAGLTFGVRQSLASTLIGLGRLDEAQSVLAQTVAVLQEQRGADHRYTQEARNDWNSFLQQHGASLSDGKPE